VPNLPAARAELVERSVDVSETQLYDADGLRPSREGDALDNVGFVSSATRTATAGASSRSPPAANDPRLGGPRTN
jgi:hypothetical protein